MDIGKEIVEHFDVGGVPEVDKSGVVGSDPTVRLSMSDAAVAVVVVLRPVHVPTSVQSVLVALSLLSSEYLWASRMVPTVVPRQLV